MSVCLYVCMCVCLYVCIYVCMYVWTDGWMDGWMDGCMYVCMSLWLVRNNDVMFRIFPHVPTNQPSHCKNKTSWDCDWVLLVSLLALGHLARCYEAVGETQHGKGRATICIGDFAGKLGWRLCQTPKLLGRNIGISMYIIRNWREAVNVQFINSTAQDVSSWFKWM